MARTEVEQKLLDIIVKLLGITNSIVKSHLLVLNQHKEFRNHTDAALVQNATQVLKEQIKEAICSQVDPFTSRSVKRLLGHPASPKGLGVQLEVARTLGILDTSAYETMVKIKNVRDVFGHTKRLLSLHEEPALAAFRALHTNPKFMGSYATVFLQYAAMVEAQIDSYLASRQPLEGQAHPAIKAVTAAAPVTPGLAPAAAPPDAAPP